MAHHQLQFGWKNICVKKGEISGSLAFSEDAPYIRGHFVNNPIVPGAILAKALQDLAYMLSKEENLEPCKILKIEKCMFRNPVYPNQTIFATINVKNNSQNTIVFHFETSCEEKLVMTGVFTFFREDRDSVSCE